MSDTALKPMQDFTIKEFAFLVGVSPKTVYNWVDAGKIESYKIIGRIRIKKEELETIKST